MAKPRITEETLRVLAAIAHLGEATPTQLRKRTGLSSGTVPSVLSRLEEAGWLARREETGTPQQLGRPLRVFYRITDECSVSQVGFAIHEVLTQMLQDLGYETPTPQTDREREYDSR